MDFVSVDDDSYRMMIEEAEREKKMRELGQERSGKKLHEIASSGWESQGEGLGGGGGRGGREERSGKKLHEIASSGWESQSKGLGVRGREGRELGQERRGKGEWEESGGGGEGGKREWGREGCL